MVKKRIKSRSCPNCGYNFGKIADLINYCPECGQENNNPRVALYRQILEFIKSLTNFDSKFWYSLKTLMFKPGTITKDYIENKRERYTSPVKMILIITAFSVSVSVIVNKSFNGNSGKSEFKADIMSFSEQFDLESDTIKYDFADFPLSLLVDDHDVSVSALRDLKHISKDSIGNWLENNRFSNNILTRLIASNAKREITSDKTWEQSANFAGSVNNILVFLLIPLSSVVFFLVFYSKERMYYDVFIFTVHSFIALIIFNMIFFTIMNFNNFWGRDSIFQDFTFFIIISFILNIIPACRKVFGYSNLSSIIRMVVAMVILLFLSLILQRILLTYWI
ncbi:MAG TPA: DUF3667 domain-containing protein [Ignavibacteria bacterium]|nr:DUF3667 domain-containing protein [Ignavibacteria bacterium]